MGGNALKNCITRRYQKEEYFKLVREVQDRISVLLPWSFPVAIKAYANKESFGDMDVILCSENLPSDYIEKLEKFFKPKELVKNGNCISFEYKELQIDLIITPKEEYRTSYYYFAYNDLGNLIGRVAHSMGLKLGHDGLSYNWRVDTYQFRNIVLLTDWEDILPVLGYDYKRYAEEFNDLEDIFKFVVSSPFFNKDIYLLHNKNHTSRVRYAKRKTYTDFLDWIEGYEGTFVQRYYAAYKIQGDKNIWLPYLFSCISGFKNTYKEVQVQWDDAVLRKSKFNGDIVKAQTGLDGKELGKFMQYLKEKQYGERWDNLIRTSTPFQIGQEIDRCYSWYKNIIP